jgi:hypothetical protein
MRFTAIEKPCGPLLMDSGENLYRWLALKARERAAQATSPSAKDALDKAAEEWSELGDLVERQHKKAAA